MYGAVLLPGKKIWIVPSKHLWTSAFHEAGHRMTLAKGSSMGYMAQQELIGMVEFCDHKVHKTRIFSGNNRMSGIAEFSSEKEFWLLVGLL